MKQIKNKPIDAGYSMLDEIEKQLKDIKNYSEWINECVEVVEDYLREMEKKTNEWNEYNK